MFLKSELYQLQLSQVFLSVVGVLTNPLIMPVVMPLMASSPTILLPADYADTRRMKYGWFGFVFQIIYPD